eukprot:TRINITY_DN1354_c0_g1_i1.p1 TRINITY_DN1354_c0_g1~~TRINITY_DN1354_c0_g1_i1.p1  ORF type:complete len:247 (+),score=65.18 TRINITY_DN1354_c0_g1_i1:151-891(+)
MLARAVSRLSAAPRTVCATPIRFCATTKSAYGRSAEHNKNIVWSEALLKPEDRANLLNAGHNGCTLWMSGLSGSGKSTIAAALEQELLEMGAHAYRLDGDNVRFGLNKDLGFSEADREENIRRISEVSALFTDCGVVTITSFISPYRASRAMARKIHEDAGHHFIEVHVHVPLEEAEKRDPKGLYVKARAGEIPNFTGISDPYEEPLEPDIKINTHEMSVHACVGALVHELKARGVISGNMRIAKD